MKNSTLRNNNKKRRGSKGSFDGKERVTSLKSVYAVGERYTT